MPQVFIPPALQPLTGDQAVVEAEGRTVRQVIEDLERRFPGVRERLCQGEALRPGLSVSVDGRYSALGLRQPLSGQAEVHFLPAIGGG